MKASSIKYKLLYILVLPLLLFFTGYVFSGNLTEFLDQEPKEDVKYIGYFPSEDERIATTSLLTVNAHSESNFVAVIEQRPHKIYLFNRKGEYIGLLGKMGNGPGEYKQPNSLSISGSEIVINDVGNGKILGIDRKGNELFSFVPEFPVAKTLMSGKHILAFPLYRRIGNREARLYTLFDKDGQKLGEYGKIPPELKTLDRYPMLNSSVFNGVLYVLPYPSNTVYKYEIGKNWYSEISLNRPGYDQIFLELREAFPEVDDNLRTKFSSIHVNQDGIFVSFFHVGLIVDYYDLEGNFLKTFDFTNEYQDEKKNYKSLDRYVRSFDMDKQSVDTYRLYAVVSGGYSRVLMFDLTI